MAIDKVKLAKLIAEAQKLVEKGSLDKAVKLYLQIVEETPKDVRIWLKVGDLQARRGEKQLATEAYLKVADTYTEQGFYLKAVAVYKQILKIDASLIEVNLRLADLYKHLGLLNDAMQQYEAIATHLGQTGKTREALGALRQIVELDPENVASRIKLAEQYSKEGLVTDAVGEFTRAADYLRGQGRVDDFAKVAERLLFHDPENVGLSKELAGLYLRRGDARRALGRLQVAFKADARDEETLVMLADAFAALGQSGKTASVLRELARIHEEAGNRDARDSVLPRLHAIEAATRALVATPAPAAVSTPAPLARPASPRSPALVVPAAVDDDLPVLEPEIEEVGDGAFEEIAPEVEAPPVTARLGGADIARVFTEAGVYLKYGLHDKALAHLLPVVQRDPGNVEARERLKGVYLAAGRFAEAAQELVEIAEQLRAADPRRAAVCLNDALDLDADNRHARALLEMMEGGAAAEPSREEPGDFAMAPEPEFEPFELPNMSTSTPTASAALVGGVAPPPDEFALEDFASDDAPSAPAVAYDDIGPVAADIDASPEIVDEGALPPTFEEAPAELAGEGAAASPNLEDELAEAAFFLQQTLLDEARALLEELIGRYPTNPAVLEKLRELEALEGPPVAAVPAPLALEDLSDRLGGGEASAPEFEMEPASSVDQIVAEVRVGVEHAELADADAHYDLAVAYHQMKMWDEAIRELEIAREDPARFAVCQTMIGLCLVAQGEASLAIDAFKQGLVSEAITAEERLGLTYELAQAYERLGDEREALSCYERIQGDDPGFRDVAERIAALTRRGGGGGGESGGGAGDDIDLAFDHILGGGGDGGKDEDARGALDLDSLLASKFP
ncbi:MAG: tetratricopeptide repeat protein [Myxococcota bacterium]